MATGNSTTVRTHPERNRHTADGKCRLCGREPEPGKKTCAICLSKQRQKYAKMRTVDRCYCGRVREPGKSRCPSCRATQRTAALRHRSTHIASGLCPCGRDRRPGKKTCATCRSRNRNRDIRYRSAGLCRCGKSRPAIGKATCLACADYKAGLVRQLRSEVIAGYGGRCVCCGETDPHVLELDHVSNDGAAHRREVGGRTYKWAIRNGFPDRLQLLCANCHSAKTRTGDCSYRAKPSGE